MRKILFSLAALLGLSACDWNSKKDYEPKQAFEEFEKQQAAVAEAAKTSAAAGGGAVAQASAEVPGKKSFETFCVACHGANGAADSPAATAMNPRPRNFTDKAWQAKVDDAHIFKVIKEGGPSVGLSPTMAAWGGAINDEEIKNVVAYVRHFGQ